MISAATAVPDAGAVRLGLNGPTAVSRAAREMAAQLQAAGTPIEGFQVQPMGPAFLSVNA